MYFSVDTSHTLMLESRSNRGHTPVTTDTAPYQGGTTHTMAIKPAKNTPVAAAVPTTPPATTTTADTDTDTDTDTPLATPPAGTPAPADGIVKPEPQPGGDLPQRKPGRPGRPAGTPMGPALVFTKTNGLDVALAEEILSGKYNNLTELVAGLKVNPVFAPQANAVTEGAIRRRLALQRKSMVQAAAQAREEGREDIAAIWGTRAHQLSFNRARGPKGSRQIDLEALESVFEDTE